MTGDLRMKIIGNNIPKMPFGSRMQKSAVLICGVLNIGFGE